MSNAFDPEAKARRLMVLLIIVSVVIYVLVMALPFIPEEKPKVPKAKPTVSNYPPYKKWALIVTVLYLPFPLMLWALATAMMHAFEREGKLSTSIPRMAIYLFSKRFDHKRAKLCQLIVILGLVWYAIAIIVLVVLASSKVIV